MTPDALTAALTGQPNFAEYVPTFCGNQSRHLERRILADAFDHARREAGGPVSYRCHWPEWSDKRYFTELRRSRPRLRLSELCEIFERLPDGESRFKAVVREYDSYMIAKQRLMQASRDLARMTGEEGLRRPLGSGFGAKMYRQGKGKKS